jgi:dipeptide/tripeptide permease
VRHTLPHPASNKRKEARMLKLLMVIAACVATIIGGLALSAVASGIGTGIALAGLIMLAGFLVYVYIRAWRNHQGDFLTPGKGYREFREEQRAAQEAAKRAAKGGRR